jgi:hypothetical protein
MPLNKALVYTKCIPPSLVKKDVLDWDDILKFVEEGEALYDHKELPPALMDEAKQSNG